MITKTKDGVEITIGAQALVTACGYLLSFKDYLSGKDGADELTKNIDVAVEIMEAFYCEHFGEDGEDET